MINSRNILVTGASGFIGSALTTSLLLDEENRVYAYVRDKNKLKNTKHKNLKIAVGDISNSEKLNQIIKENRIDLVYHLAANNDNISTNSSPLSIFDSNIQGTYSLLEACRNNKETVKKIIITSSKEADISESLDEICKKRPYAISKICTELLAKSYAHNFDLNIVILKSDNLYGEGDFNLNRLIPNSIISLNKDIPPKLRSNGQIKRGYIYIADIINAMQMLAEEISNEPSYGDVYLFNSTNTFSAYEIVNMIANLMKKNNIVPTIGNTSKNERVEILNTNHNYKYMANWQPEFNIEQGLAKTIEWYKKKLGQ